MDKQKKYLIRTGSSFSWAERETIVKDYLRGGYTKSEIWKKHTGLDEEHGQLLSWMRKLGYVADKDRKRVLTLQPQSFYTLAEKTDKSTQELEKRIKLLEDQLENALLKAEGYKLMIEIAEEKLKIPIRKKSGTR